MKNYIFYALFCLLLCMNLAACSKISDPTDKNTQVSNDIYERKSEFLSFQLTMGEDQDHDQFKQQINLIKSRLQASFGEENVACTIKDKRAIIRYNADLQNYTPSLILIPLISMDFRVCSKSGEGSAKSLNMKAEDVLEAQVKCGRIEDVSPSSYGLAEDQDYYYLEIVFSDNFIKQLQDSLGTDSLQTLYYSSYTYSDLLWSKDGKTYLIDSTQSEPYFQGLAYTLEHLPSEKFPKLKADFEEKVFWEAADNKNRLPGQYQVSINDFKGSYSQLTYSICLDKISSEEDMENCLAQLKNRLDLLKVRYALGYSSDSLNVMKEYSTESYSYIDLIVALDDRNTSNILLWYLFEPIRIKVRTQKTNLTDEFCLYKCEKSENGIMFSPDSLWINDLEFQRNVKKFKNRKEEEAYLYISDHALVSCTSLQEIEKGSLEFTDFSMASMNENKGTLCDFLCQAPNQNNYMINSTITQAILYDGNDIEILGDGDIPGPYEAEYLKLSNALLAIDSDIQIDNRTNLYWSVSYHFPKNPTYADLNQFIKNVIEVFKSDTSLPYSMIMSLYFEDYKSISVNLNMNQSDSKEKYQLDISDYSLEGSEALHKLKDMMREDDFYQDCLIE